MKLYAPAYYRSFACIADRCRHNCCIGWEIDVDSDTMEKYAACTDGYGREILESIDTDGTPHFRLGEGDRCPHLESRGLCRIITELGEAYLCHICRAHPRFFNDTPCRREVGIGMACEEACRLILSADDYRSFVEIGEIGETAGVAITCDFDALNHRAAIYEILADPAILYPDRLKKISLLYAVSPADLPDSAWREELSSLEYLDAAHKALFSNYSSDLYTLPASEKPLERALAYMIFRHCSEACDVDAFRASLGFCLMMERLLASLIKEGGGRDMSDIAELARIVSEELEYSEENTEAIRAVFAFE